ncbi:hypothetical protein DAPPUDRAFT_322369 [Daphnia pulex]|uniref:DUF4789 domain-containing protein n=1 Tax=Daphnia pulex TaxID=6669 RepID=E9GVQ7_DAPPU|nr:hypothetical protein DAPPUDRAFT_322369 [Daphnia pulex]|eukprot:EFX76450.1 hypothetical protein DAPPUDRAFT_322369 [Daphnia pulex]
MAESLLTLLMANLLQLIVFIFSWTSNQDLSHTNATHEGFIAENSLIDLSTQSPLAVVSNLTSVFDCLSPNERFYIIDDQLSCFELMTQGPCKPNQLFYLDSDDSGICDCENSLFIYSAETGECYQQNSQGPCKDGEWFTLTDGILSCEPLPDGCLADGHYVFWSPDYEGSSEASEKQCWLLGSQGPCSENETLERYATNTVGCQLRAFKIGRRPHGGNEIDERNPEDKEAESRSPSGRSVAVAGMRPCGPGSRRTQTGKCRPNIG